MAQIRIGCELEGGYKSRHGSPLDVLGTLNGGIKTGNPYEEVTGDMGLYSLELVTPPCESASGIMQSFNRLTQRLPHWTVPVFGPLIFGPKVPLANKVRVTAVSDALAREHSNGAAGVGQVAPWASLQFQISNGSSLLTIAGVFFRDFLENIGPDARLQVIKRFGVKGWQEHQLCWYGFSNPDRMPAPRRFNTPEELERFVAGIPQLVTLKDGEWAVADAGTMSRLGNPESDGTLWWSARFRRFADGGETIEWRPFESMLPEHVKPLADEVFKLAHGFWDFVEAHPDADWANDGWRARMYTHVHAICPLLVPERPLEVAQWWLLTEE